MLNESDHDIKNQFEKHSQKYEIIHMIIKKYIINGAVNIILPKNIEGDYLVTQVNFICLENKVVENLRKIFYGDYLCVCTYCTQISYYF